VTSHTVAPTRWRRPAARPDPRTCVVIATRDRRAELRATLARLVDLLRRRQPGAEIVQLAAIKSPAPAEPAP
jgi:hypothetical protein